MHEANIGIEMFGSGEYRVRTDRYKKIKKVSPYPLTWALIVTVALGLAWLGATR